MTKFRDIFIEELGSHDPFTPKGIEGVFEDAERAAIKYSQQRASEILTDIGRVIYNSDKSPQERVNEIKDLLSFKYRNENI